MKNRPEALENLRRSLNLTVTFLQQVAVMKEKDEIFTSKDLEDVWKVLNETVVSILHHFTLIRHHCFLPIIFFVKVSPNIALDTRVFICENKN